MIKNEGAASLYKGMSAPLAGWVCSSLMCVCCCVIGRMGAARVARLLRRFCNTGFPFFFRGILFLWDFSLLAFLCQRWVLCGRLFALPAGFPSFDLARYISDHVVHSVNRFHQIIYILICLFNTNNMLKSRLIQYHTKKKCHSNVRALLLWLWCWPEDFLERRYSRIAWFGSYRIGWRNLW